MGSYLNEYLAGSVPKGERNRALFCAACRAVEEGMHENDIYSTLGAKAMRDGLKGLEIQSTIKSALRTASVRSDHRCNGSRILAWDAVLPAHKPSAPKPELPQPAEDFEFTDLPRFLTALFQDGEYVGINTAVQTREDGKAVPNGWGDFKRTAAELQALLSDSQASEALHATEHGAWVRLNPLDGQGIKDGNVAAFRHALVESDTLPVAEQWRIVNRLRLPVSTCVHSGSKSLHFAVKIDASGRAEYDRRVTLLYEYLSLQGMSVDKQNKNPSRLSRMPGVWRGDKPQYLLATNIGFASWAEFEASITAPEPDTDRLIETDVRGWTDTPAPIPTYVFEGLVPTGIVCGLFAQGGSGKGWLVETLILSLTLGIPLLPSFRPAVAGRVLWIESEDPADELHRRYQRIRHGYGVSSEQGKTFEAGLHLFAGQAFPLCETVGNNVLRTARYKEIAAIVSDVQPSLIVIDPFAHFFAGDENSNTEVSSYMNYLRDLTKLSKDCSLWVNHHVGKSNEKSMETNAARGATAIRDSIRASFNLAPLTPEECKEFGIDTPHLFVKLAMSKANYTERADTTIFFRRDTGAFGGVLREIDMKTLKKEADTTRDASEAIIIAEVIGDNPQDVSIREIRDQSGGDDIRERFRARCGRASRSRICQLLNIATENGLLVLQDVVSGKRTKQVPRCGIVKNPFYS